VPFLIDALKTIKISWDKEGDIMEIRFSEEAIAESEYVEE